MNIIFTIVAKNYLSLAITLADSIKKLNADQPFYILLADNPDNLPTKYFDQHNIFLSRDINIPNIKELSFKYNVTEFCTAIKPFFMDFLIKKGANRIIYLDPDIYLFQDPQLIFDELDDHEILITPHIICMQETFTGEIPETEMLFSGIFNLGFIALKNSPRVQQFINWWKIRLSDYCYGDRMESLHVDQKWIDFLPSFFSRNELKIISHPGYNIAYWNIHERILELQKKDVIVSAKCNTKIEFLPVIFMHFSGLDPLNIYINKQCPSLIIDQYPVWKRLIISYSEKVIENDFELLKKLPYSFATFENGEAINTFHRRIYRRLLTTKQSFNCNLQDPFKTGKNTMFDLFRSNDLLLGNTVVEQKITEENMNRSTKKLKKINLLLLWLKKIIGLNSYIVLLRFCQKYFRPENQIFLLKEYRKEAEDKYFEK